MRNALVSVHGLKNELYSCVRACFGLNNELYSCVSRLFRFMD